MYIKSIILLHVCSSLHLHQPRVGNKRFLCTVGPVNRIGFDPVTYAVDEDAGQVTIIVRILAGSFSSPVLLFVRSLDGTAVGMYVDKPLTRPV